MRTRRILSTILLWCAYSASAAPDAASVKKELQKARRVGGAEDLVDKPVAHVLFFAGVKCPIAKDYLARMAEYHKSYNAKPDADEGERRNKRGPKRGNVQFYAIFSNFGDDADAVKKLAEAESLPFPAYYEAGKEEQKLANLLGAKKLSETFVFDRDFKLVYRGAFDDQFTIDSGLRRARPKVKKSYVKMAIEDALVGNTMLTESIAYGCHLERPIAEKPSNLTYVKDIAPIFREKCEVCHGPQGSMADYPLTTFTEVRGAARTVAERVGQRVMPPWGLDPTVGVFHNDRGLTNEQVATILEWVDSGAKEGDSKKTPPARPIPPKSEWVLEERFKEKADLVLELPQAIEVKSRKEKLYEPYHYVPLVKLDDKDLPRKVEKLLGKGDRWLKWSEVKPSAPQVIHHIIPYILRPEGEQVHDKEPGLGEKLFAGGLLQQLLGNYYFDYNAEDLAWYNLFYGMKLNKLSWEVARYVPGEPYTVYPEGFGVRIPEGSNIVFEMHITPGEKPATERSKVALKFWDKPPKYEVNTLPLGHFAEIKIPPKHPNYEMVKSYKFDKPALILGSRPHAHLRGRDFLFELFKKDGKVTKLLSVPRYDFNNQPFYRFKEPIAVEADDVVKMTVHYNNSLSNPSLTEEMTEEEIRFGVQTDREMFFGYLTVAFLANDDKKKGIDK